LQAVFWKKEDKDLVEVIPREFLTSEYGGAAGNYDELLGLFQLSTSTCVM